MDTRNAMKYIVVSVYHSHTFEQAVNEKITEGYLPVGGPFIDLNNKLSQAMLLSTPLNTDAVSTKAVLTKKEKSNAK